MSGKTLLLCGFVLALAVPGLAPAQAQTATLTPLQAYKQGCGGCHTSEAKLLRTLPRGNEATMRAWLNAFMTGHPCEADPLKPLIIEYLVSKTAK